MRFSEFDVTNVVKTFVRNVESSPIMQDLHVRNGSKEKGRTHVDSVQERSRILIREQRKLFELFVRNKTAKI